MAASNARLHERGYGAILGDVANTAGEEEQTLDRFLSYPVDGVIFAVWSMTPIPEIAACPVPLIQIDHDVYAERPFVGLDAKLAAIQLCAHVREKGYRRAGLLSYTAGTERDSGSATS